MPSAAVCRVACERFVPVSQRTYLCRHLQHHATLFLRSFLRLIASSFVRGILHRSLLGTSSAISRILCFVRFVCLLVRSFVYLFVGHVCWCAVSVATFMASRGESSVICYNFMPQAANWRSKAYNLRYDVRIQRQKQTNFRPSRTHLLHARGALNILKIYSH